MLSLGALYFVYFRPEPPDLLSDASGASVYVIDGDSLRIGGHTVRLKGIDAVELHQSCDDVDGAKWACGQQARAALVGMIARGGLVCELLSHDTYSRSISRCFAQGSHDLAADLVAQGWAVNLTPFGRRYSPLVAPYATQEAQAQTVRRGIWRGGFQRPAEWRAAHPRDAISG